MDWYQYRNAALVKFSALYLVPISNGKQWYWTTFTNIYHVSKSVLIQMYKCIHSFYKVRRSHDFIPDFLSYNQQKQASM